MKSLWILTSFLKHTIYLVIGSLCVPLIIICTTLSIPVYIYRWIIINLVAPWFKKDIGNVADPISQVFAIEFLKPKTPTRCTLIINTAFEGQIEFEELYKAVDQKWIKATGEDGNILFPELQHYLESWMGFMFWKRDKEFDLKNHLFLHRIADGASEKDSACFSQELVEKLLNKCYPLKRSPWEMHLIQNFVSSEFPNVEGKNLSVVILRAQHAIGDMHALLELLVEHLYGLPMSDAKRAQPTPRPAFRLIDYATYPIKLIYQLGYIVAGLIRPRTFLHISDSEKSWHQICDRGPLIPTTKIKHVRKTFGATFAGVINSSISAALSKMNKKRMGENPRLRKLPSNFLILNSLFRPNRPRKLMNHILGIIFDIPGLSEMSHIARLLECNQNEKQARDSPMPQVSALLLQLVTSQLAPLTRLLVANRYVATGVSNFPGIGVQCTWNGMNKVVDMNFLVGGFIGDASVAFMVHSYVDQIRICATAEEAIFSREELKLLIDSVCEEIDSLFALASIEK